METMGEQERDILTLRLAVGYLIEVVANVATALGPQQMVGGVDMAERIGRLLEKAHEAVSDHDGG
jgi:hypothetical protein